MEQNTIYLYSLNITFISCSKPIFWVKKFPPLPISGFRVPTYLTKKVLFFLLSLPLSVDRNKKKRKDLSDFSWSKIKFIIIFIPNITFISSNKPMV